MKQQRTLLEDRTWTEVSERDDLLTLPGPSLLSPVNYAGGTEGASLSCLWPYKDVIWVCTHWSSCTQPFQGSQAIATSFSLNSNGVEYRACEFWLLSQAWSATSPARSPLALAPGDSSACLTDPETRKPRVPKQVLVTGHRWLVLFWFTGIRRVYL